jgi:hypothetical protein
LSAIGAVIINASIRVFVSIFTHCSVVSNRPVGGLDSNQQNDLCNACNVCSTVAESASVGFSACRPLVPIYGDAIDGRLLLRKSAL